MALMISDEDVEREIARQAAGLHLSPVEVVRRAVQSQAANEVSPAAVGPDVIKKRLDAIQEAQAWFAAQPNADLRPINEIIGYNEHGHFD